MDEFLFSRFTEALATFDNPPPLPSWQPEQMQPLASSPSKPTSKPIAESDCPLIVRVLTATNSSACHFALVQSRALIKAAGCGLLAVKEFERVEEGHRQRYYEAAENAGKTYWPSSDLVTAKCAAPRLHLLKGCGHARLKSKAGLEAAEKEWTTGLVLYRDDDVVRLCGDFCVARVLQAMVGKLAMGKPEDALALAEFFMFPKVSGMGFGAEAPPRGGGEKEPRSAVRRGCLASLTPRSALSSQRPRP